MNKDIWFGLSIGLLLGCILFTVANDLGMRRYSDAVAKCIRLEGPNK